MSTKDKDSKFYLTQYAVHSSIVFVGGRDKLAMLLAENSKLEALVSFSSDTDEDFFDCLEIDFSVKIPETTRATIRNLTVSELVTYFYSLSKPNFASSIYNSL